MYNRLLWVTPDGTKRRCTVHAGMTSWRASQDTGITRTALHATADGYPGYIRMGYRPVEEFDLYVPQ